MLPVLPIKLKKLSFDGYRLVRHGRGPQNGPQLVRKIPSGYPIMALFRVTVPVVVMKAK